MLIQLEKIALELGLPETEVRNLAVYNRLRRQPGGVYDEAALLRMLVKHLKEELYGCAAGDYAPPLRRGPGVDTTGLGKFNFAIASATVVSHLSGPCQPHFSHSEIYGRRTSGL